MAGYVREYGKEAAYRDRPKTLNDWLEKVNATLVWAAGRPGFRLEGWSVNGVLLHVTRWSSGGWDVHVPASHSLRAAECLARAAKVCGTADDAP